MKLSKNIIWFTHFLLLMTCGASLTWAQPSDSLCSILTPNNLAQESRVNEICLVRPEGNFYCNPLMLEGMTLTDYVFTMKSKGELKLVKGDPKSGKVIEIPFYLRLRRYGLIAIHPCGEDVIFSKVEISAILKAAENGDELIVEPVNEEDRPARRTVKIMLGC